MPAGRIHRVHPTPYAATRFRLGIWQASLVCFILAAATGILMRYSLLNGFPFGLHFGDVRHAHSHLMFFGWATPVLMLLMLQFQGDTDSRPVRWLLVYTLVVAVFSWLPFMLSGYRLMPLFGRELPVSMIVSGLSGVAWFSFMVMYMLRERGRQRGPAGPFFRAAILLLLISSLGVGALAVAGMTGAGSVMINALAFFYLELFAEGWFGVALIGVAWQLHPGVKSTSASRFGLPLLVVALTVRCLADVFVKTGLPALEPVVLAGSGLAGLGLLLALLPLWRVLARQRLSLWHLSILLLSAKGVFDLLLSIPYMAAWSDAAGLNVFYLHAFLLGALSIGLIAAARAAWRPDWFRFPWLFSAVVLIMIAALLPLSGAWPPAWAGRWTLEAALWTSAGPVIVMLMALLGRPRMPVQSARVTSPSD